MIRNLVVKSESPIRLVEHQRALKHGYKGAVTIIRKVLLHRFIDHSAGVRAGISAMLSNLGGHNAYGE